MASVTQILYYQNDMMVEFSGLQNSIDDSYLNGATVLLTLVDSDNNEVSGQTWPLVLVHDGGLDGVYQGIMDSVIDITVGLNYTAHITAVEGTLNGAWSIPLIVRTRKFI